VICCTNKCIINERYIPEHQNKLNIYDLQKLRIFSEFFSTEKKFIKFEFSIYGVKHTAFVFVAFAITVVKLELNELYSCL